MRVFCPEHKRGFFTPRQSPIRCENSGHLLGELNFAGEAKAPVTLQWQYCCNCEHFCPLDAEQDGLESCPVCTRRSSMLYLCDRCYTISFESNTPLQTKNFTLTSEGAPQPSCPGCLQAASADLREHTCDGLGASLTTALNSCPICLERLDVGPSFPSSVAHYLKRTKAANKVNVTFDYESALFVPVEDGEFVLISTGNETVQTIALPRAARFTSRRDFYEFYQDYYHCAKPEAGEVHIIQPAAVVPTVAGWKLLAPGILETHPEQPKQNALAGVGGYKADTSARVEPAPAIPKMKEETPATPCTHCGALVETKYPFCWKCGKPMRAKSESPVRYKEKSGAIAATASGTDEEDLTVQHEAPPGAPPLFSWALAKDTEGPGSSKGSVLKLIAVGVVVLVLLSLGLFALTYSISRTDSVTTAQTVPANLQSEPAPGREEKRDVATEPAPQRPAGAHPEDDVLKTLRETRLAATSFNRSAVLQAFARAEKQYPNDYRLPYERAKLAIKDPQSGSHEEAFSALSLAAERAISAGKTHEMLHGLTADKAGDFNKLAHDHREWSQLVKALKSQDTSLLSAKA